MKKKKLEGDLTEDKKIKFNLIEVIIIMIITSICSITLSIMVSYTMNKTSNKIKVRNDLSELIDTYETITDEYYTDVDKKALIASAIEAMVGQLDDPYSLYLDEKESKSFAEDLSGKYVGIGVKIKNDNNKILIVEVFKDGPSDKVGIKEGDKIIAVDGKEIKTADINNVPNLIKGEKGTKVKLQIERASEKLDFEVLRSSVDIESVTYKTITNNDKKIGLVSIDSFAANTTEQFKKVSEKFKNDSIEGIIIDLRGNTGGYLSSAEAIASMFVKKGAIIYQLSSKNKTKKILNEKEPSINLKTVVLTNSSTASASEILTAALKENLGSEVVGTKTYGKGKVQKLKKLTDGSTIKYTIENWLTPLGDEIDNKGIEPTFLVELDKEYIKNPEEKNDNQLKKALEMFGNKTQK